MFCLEDAAAAVQVTNLPVWIFFKRQMKGMEGLVKDITSGEMHVIALTLHTLEPFTPRQSIRCCCGKNMPCVCHRLVLLGHEEQSSDASYAHRPAPTEKWWHPWRWLLSPPCPSPRWCFPCNALLCPPNTPAVTSSLCQEYSNPKQPRPCVPSARSQLQKQLSWSARETRCSSYFQECAPTED